MEVILTYTNPLGKAAVFHTQRLSNGQHPPYLANSIIGVGGPPLEYENTPLTGSDGSHLGTPRYTSRIVQTNCYIYGTTDEERDLEAEKLIGILNPALGDGTLTYQNHRGIFYADARVKLMPSFGANSKIGEWKPVLIDYECAYPYWRGTHDYSAIVAASSKILKLPFMLPFYIGMQGYEATAENLAAVYVPVKIVIMGPVVNPVIANKTTKQSLRVRKTVPADSTLTIVTGPAVSVTIENADGSITDAMNYVNLLGTDWVKLKPGMNDLTYTSDDSFNDTRIVLYWHDWYLGVG